MMTDWMEESVGHLRSHPYRYSLQRRVVYPNCGCHLMRHALVCMTAYYLLVVIGLFAGGEVLSALGPFHFHVSPRCWRWFCVWLWVLVLWLVCVVFLWLFLCCCVSVLAGALFFLLYAAWVRSRAERPSVSYTKAVMEVAWTGHNLQITKTN